MTQAAFDPLVDIVKGFLRNQSHLATIISNPAKLEWRERPHLSLACLPEILALDDPPTHFLRNLQDHIKAVAPLAEWRRSYTKKAVGENFLNNYGYFELFGPNGHYRCDNCAAFIGYCGPGLFYNWHVHRADEVCLVINGTPTFHSDPNQIQTPMPGMVRLHSSLQPHAITTGSDPLLTLALWGGEGIDLLPTMLTRRRPWRQRINYAMTGPYERKSRKSTGSYEQKNGKSYDQKERASEVEWAGKKWPLDTEKIFGISGQYRNVSDFRPLASLTNLREVGLKNSNIRGDDLIHLSELPKLRFIDLGGTQITDAGLQHLSGIASLKYLGLDGTQITGSGLRHFAHKTEFGLSLSGTKISDANLYHLSDIKGLTSLSLADTMVTGTGLAALSEMKSLRQLLLNRAQLTDDGMAALGKLTSLKTLSLNQTHFSDTGLEQLSSLTNLESLDLSSVTKISDTGLRSLSALGRLRKLHLSKTQVAGGALSQLSAELEGKLEELSLSGTPVADLAPLSRFTGLKRLWLNKTLIADECLKHLAPLKSLRELWLSKEVTDAGLVHLSGLVSLEVLDLAYAQVTDDGLRNALSVLPSLRSLELEGTTTSQPWQIYGRADVQAFLKSKP